MESFRADVHGITFKDNKYGIRLSVGCTDNFFEDNGIIDSSKYNVYTYEGSDKPYTVSSGRYQDNEFKQTKIEEGKETIKLQDSDGTASVGNAFSDVSTIRLDDAANVLMSGNTGLDGSYELKVQNGGCFDASSDDEFEPSC